MNMPSYFYDAARIFERRAAVDAGQDPDAWIFYSFGNDEFYFSGYRTKQNDQKICMISEIDSGDYREFADVDLDEIFTADFNVLKSVKKYAPIIEYICGFAETLADEAEEIREEL